MHLWQHVITDLVHLFLPKAHLSQDKCDYTTVTDLLGIFFCNRQSSVALNNGPVTDSFTYFINLLWLLIPPPQNYSCMSDSRGENDKHTLSPESCCTTKCLPVAGPKALQLRLFRQTARQQTSQSVLQPICLPSCFPPYSLSKLAILAAVGFHLLFTCHEAKNVVSLHFCSQDNDWIVQLKLVLLEPNCYFLFLLGSKLQLCFICLNFCFWLNLV